jgi:hypothetical protein
MCGPNVSDNHAVDVIVCYLVNGISTSTGSCFQSYLSIGYLMHSVVLF